MKQVPVPSEMRVGADGLMDRTLARSMINYDCHFALEQALQIKAGLPEVQITVVSMGPPSFQQSHIQALRAGADHCALLSDRALAGSDTFATGLALATTLKHLGFSTESRESFLILTGRQTTDGDTAHVPSQVAENLGLPQVTYVEHIQPMGESLRVRRIIEGGHMELELPLPCLLSIAPTATPPRGPSLMASYHLKEHLELNKQSKEIFKEGAPLFTLLTAAEVGLKPDQVGLEGSPTIVAAAETAPKPVREHRLASGEGGAALVESLVELAGAWPS